jgi:hypothetical protein
LPGEFLDGHRRRPLPAPCMPASRRRTTMTLPLRPRIQRPGADACQVAAATRSEKPRRSRLSAIFRRELGPGRIATCVGRGRAAAAAAP